MKKYLFGLVIIFSTLTVSPPAKAQYFPCQDFQSAAGYFLDYLDANYSNMDDASYQYYIQFVTMIVSIYQSMGC